MGVTVTLVCDTAASEGADSELIKLERDGNALRMNRIGGADPEDILVRCP